MDIPRAANHSHLANVAEPCCPEHLDRLLFGLPGNPLVPCDRSTLRPYVAWRLDHFLPDLLQNWTPGDILFVGDSLTDMARVYDCNPVLPRSFNIGILGSRISDARYVIKTLSKEFRQQNRPLEPSKLVILIGTNDLLRSVDGNFNSFDDATEEQYLRLFEVLNEFREDNPGCEIVARSVPPGIPLDPPPECPWTYKKNTPKFQQAVRKANDWLYKKWEKPKFDYTVYDNYTDFWDTVTDNIRFPLYRGLYDDFLHIGCEGYKLVFTQLMSYLYGALPALDGSIANLASSPAKAPSSGLQLPLMHYRYVYFSIPPAQQLKVSVANSESNYAAIIGPPNAQGYPASENLKTDGTQAEAVYGNSASAAEAVVLCMGGQTTSAEYSVQIQPLA